MPKLFRITKIPLYLIPETKLNLLYIISGRSENSVDTPLRYGNRQAPGTVAESSEGQSVPASSPNRLLQTSPIAGGMSEIDLSSPLNYGTPSSLGSIRTPRSGIRGTPIRQRPDIRTDKRLRQVNVTEPVCRARIGLFLYYLSINIRVILFPIYFFPQSKPEILLDMPKENFPES